MRTRHLLGCAAVLAVGVIALIAIGPSASGLAVLATFLLCPLVMIVAMKLLMSAGRDSRSPTGPRAPARPAPQELRR